MTIGTTMTKIRMMVREIGFLCIWNQPKNGFKKEVEQEHLFIFAKYLLYLMIFQRFAAPSVRSNLKNHQTIHHGYRKK